LGTFEPESFKATTKEGAGKRYEIIYKIGGTQKIQVNVDTQDD